MNVYAVDECKSRSDHLKRQRKWSTNYKLLLNDWGEVGNSFVSAVVAHLLMFTSRTSSSCPGEREPSAERENVRERGGMAVAECFGFGSFAGTDHRKNSVRVRCLSETVVARVIFWSRSNIWRSTIVFRVCQTARWSATIIIIRWSFYCEV